MQIVLLPWTHLRFYLQRAHKKKRIVMALQHRLYEISNISLKINIKFFTESAIQIFFFFCPSASVSMFAC